MAITYDAEITPNYMYFYDDSAGTYVSRNLTTGDFFDNNSAVGDYVAIGRKTPSVPWHNIKFFIGTQLVADAITVVWEYHKSGVWTAIPGLTDNTNAFRVAGEQWVTFPVPTEMRANTSTWYLQLDPATSATRCIWVRCRITAVTAITEGGAQSTQSVAVKNHTIVCTDELSLTATVLYNADVAGSWGVVTKPNSDTCMIKANWQMVNSDFTSTREFISVGTPKENCLIWNDANSTFRIGQLDGSGYGELGTALFHHCLQTIDGYMSIYNAYIYGSLLNRPYGSYAANQFNAVCDIRDSVLISFQTFYFPSTVSSGNFLRTLWAVDAAIYIYTGNLTIANIQMVDSCGGLLMGTGTAVASNITFLPAQKIQRYYACQAYNIDSSGISNRTTQYISSSPSGVVDVYIYEQYHFDLRVVDEKNTNIANAQVQLFNNAGTEIFNVATAANGTITQQLVTVFDVYWDYSAAWARVDEDWNDFTIRISANGFETYRKIWTFNKKTDWTIKLRQSISPGRDDMGGEFR